jgi:hypothetical protein
MRIVYAFVVALVMIPPPLSCAESIHDAIRHGDRATVASILESNPALIQATDTVGYTPLHFAAAYAQWDILEFILERGAPVNVEARDRCTPLHCACMYDEPRAIALLLRHGADSSLAGRDIYGEYTPLLRAAQRGCAGVIALLLERGADPAAVTREGWSALHLAALSGHGALFDLLIRGGVPEDIMDRQGRRYRECVLERPARISIDGDLLDDYIGAYGPFVSVLEEHGRLLLDDHSLNELYPIGKDTFFCDRDPWKAAFRRDERGEVDGVELFFLRRSVFVDKSDSCATARER